MKTKTNYCFAFLILFFFTMSFSSAQDVVKVAAESNKLLADTLGMRLIEFTIAPGATINMHNHPDHAVYVLEGGTLESTDSKGKKDMLELKTGTGVIVPANQHVTKNVGKSTIRGVLVEVKRDGHKH